MSQNSCQMKSVRYLTTQTTKHALATSVRVVQEMRLLQYYILNLCVSGY